MTSTLSNGSQEMPVNLLTIYVGPPTTGKSQALKECAVSPIPLSAKIYDVLFKLLKFDEENATRNIQVLWQLFSGEQSSYWYATESTREIFYTTFCIVGSTQVPFTARLITEGPTKGIACWTITSSDRASITVFKDFTYYWLRQHFYQNQATSFQPNHILLDRRYVRTCQTHPLKSMQWSVKVILLLRPHPMSSSFSTHSQISHQSTSQRHRATNDCQTPLKRQSVTWHRLNPKRRSLLGKNILPILDYLRNNNLL